MDMQQKFSADCHLISRNKNGNIDTVLPGEKVILETSIGNLVPRYNIDDDAGRRKEAPVKFYKTGELKSLPLEEISEIPTTVGNIKSELVIFYKNGALYRAFPLNGKVTGFWTEENEYTLAETLEIPTSLGSIKVKPIYLQFYETGELESVLFWPDEKIKVKTVMGEILIRKGIAFHKNGNIKGFEPVEEVSVESPIGSIKAFDPDPNGIQAENHSLNFYEDGTLKSVITSSNQIVVLKDGVEYKRFSPKLVISYCNENAFFISPLKILFEEDSISFNNINESVEKLPKSLQYSIADFVSDKPVSEIGCV
jgi:antitoxin component YwqK of YwqJK toxin-antitoxin module